jgi:MFS family permease
MSSGKPPRIRRIQWIAVAFLTAAGIVNYLDRSTLSIANHDISGELGLSGTQMGLLLSAFSWAYTFSQLPVGAMLDRFGARIMLGAGMFFWSLAQLAGGLAQSLGQLIGTRAVLGVGEAPQFPAGAKVISEWFPMRERGVPTGIFVASACIGPAIAPPILTAIMLAFGWRPMFVLMGVLGLIVAIGWYLIYRNRGETALTETERSFLDDGRPAQAKPQQSFAEWAGLFGNLTTWGMVVGFMGVVYMVWLYLTWLPGYLEHERHLSIARTGWVVVIPYLFGALGMLCSGKVADVLLARGVGAIASRKWPMAAGLVGGAVFTLPAAYTPSLTLAVVYISLAMFCINYASSTAWMLVTAAAPSRQVASLGSIQNFGGYFAGSFAPIVTGFVLDRTGSFVNALLISAAVAAVAAVALVVLVRNPIEDRATASPVGGFA